MIRHFLVATVWAAMVVPAFTSAVHAADPAAHAADPAAPALPPSEAAKVLVLTGATNHPKCDRRICLD